MTVPNDLTKHQKIQKAIVSAFKNIGNVAIQEYTGKGWRADVFVPNFGKPYAFEIQISPQTLKRTLERQAKYIRDGIVCCWFFENPVTKLNEERPDLPLFYVEEDDNYDLIVNLGTRRKINLQIFLENFISKNIQFKTVAKTRKMQDVNLVFYKMDCWKCGARNFLYYVKTPFYTDCNAQIFPEEALWDSSNIEYNPQIIQLAKTYENTMAEKLNLATIKDRYSYTVEHSYKSFGCYKCDSIFGDFYVMDAKMDVIYDEPEFSCHGEIELTKRHDLKIPHWCFPKNGEFCED